MPHDGVRRATVQCRNEADAAGIVFVTRVIQARGWRQTHAVSLFGEGDDRAAELPRPPLRSNRALVSRAQPAFSPGSPWIWGIQGGVQAASSRARLTPVDWSTVTPFCTVQAYTASDTCLRERPLESLCMLTTRKGVSVSTTPETESSAEPCPGNGWPALRYWSGIAVASSRVRCARKVCPLAGY